VVDHLTDPLVVSDDTPRVTREAQLAALASDGVVFDLLVVGGGATGLGVAVDAAARGYRTALVEAHDFAKGTSSRSTKLIHGGVRYLQQGHLGLVVDALRERGRLTANAGGLVRPLPFVVPTYTWWQAPFYGVGLKLYDTLAGRLGLGASRHLSREETLRRLPTLEPHGLRGGIEYFDGQFDDARLAVALLATALAHGAVCVNYAPVTRLVRERDALRGVVVRDVETGREIRVASRVVVNATGVFADHVRRLDDPACDPVVTASQGTHLVLPRVFLPGDTAIMVPRTDDGRVLFAIPWHERVLIGTTDTPVSDITNEPTPRCDEVAFLLEHAARYLTRAPTRRDVLSVFAGLRPLVSGAGAADSAAVARDHTVITATSGLVTVTGGKWTTYRQMAEDAVNAAALVAGLPERACLTAGLALARAMIIADGERLHDRLPYTTGDVIRAVRYELARTVEDVLARRTRALLLDAAAAVDAAELVAAILSREFGRDCTDQAAAFVALARSYQLTV
jgi:glycerol-3-phosphate dehydrogenase